MKALELNPGDKVLYHGVPATVLYPRHNGVTIQYWVQKGPRAGELEQVRVAARHLTSAA